MRDRDVRAHALIDEFFDHGMSLREEADARWRDSRELDQVTVTQIRLWAANRTLAAFAPGWSAAVRSRIVAERDALEQWLADHSRCDECDSSA
ncbi:hypothetical protein AB0L59_02300 [Streptomyces sp. NPDC052109]|uniref:hypothetical protein n=1 Tax=Streptomyces sp. NPDC052109 TaxID=3155527 RepID=UPI00341A29D4